MRSNAMRLDGWKLAVAIMATALVGMTIMAQNVFPAVCPDAPEFWCVEKNDTVSQVIAPTVKLSTRIIGAMNPGKDLNVIYPGDRIKIKTDRKSFEEILRQEKAYLLEEIGKIRSAQQIGQAATDEELKDLRTSVEQLEARINELATLEAERTRLEAAEAKRPLAVAWRFIQKNWQMLGFLFMASLLCIILFSYRSFLSKRRFVPVRFTLKEVTYIITRHDVNWRGELLAFEKRKGRRLAYPLAKLSLYRRSVIDSITKDENLLKKLWRKDWIEVAEVAEEDEGRTSKKERHLKVAGKAS